MKKACIDFRFKKVDEARNYLLGKIKHNELISKKHKKTCAALNYIEHLLILATTIARCVSISSFVSVVGMSVGITSSGVRIKICVITTEIRSYNSIIKKQRRKKTK